MGDKLKDRGRALEEHFFAEQDRKLLDELRQREQHAKSKDEIAKATGITDDEVLGRLVAMNIDTETLMALTLTPLVEVAWADGNMEQKERDAIGQAAAQAGINEGDPAHTLLSGWLTRKPDAELFTLWKDYVAELTDEMKDDAVEQLRDDVLAQARGVAKASGGILGMASISGDEQKVLDELAAAFG